MSRLARLEGSARILALVKLANVGLVLIWGFAVTFVFVRVLPIAEFQAFLLLVAFGNFTISAEFGLTSIIYARLRRHWLGRGEGTDEAVAREVGLPRPEQINTSNKKINRSNNFCLDLAAFISLVHFDQLAQHPISIYFNP